MCVGLYVRSKSIQVTFITAWICVNIDYSQPNDNFFGQNISRIIHFWDEGNGSGNFCDFGIRVYFIFWLYLTFFYFAAAIGESTIELVNGSVYVY